MGRTATQLHADAVDLSIRGRYAAARGLLVRAAAVADDPNLRARVAGTLAVIAERTGKPAEARQICQEALQIPGLTTHTRAILHGQLGALAMYGGRLDEADAWFSRAISHLSDDELARARNRMNRSLVNMRRRRLSAAREDLEAALAIYEHENLRVEAAYARHNLGYIALLEGNVVEALQSMLAARTDANTSPVAGAIGDLDRAEVLRDAGLTGEAERTLAEVASVFGAHRMPQSRAEAELQLARSLLAHDRVRAAQVAGTAARRFARLESEAWMAQADAIRLRALLAPDSTRDRGRRRRPVTPQQGEVDHAVASLERLGFRAEAMALRFAQELSLARSGSAVRRDRPPTRLSPTASIDIRLLAHEVRAARAAASGRGAAARRHVAAGLDELAGWRRTFGSLDLHTAAVVHGTGLIFAGLSSAVDSGIPAVVFEWSERARQLSQEVVPLRPPPDEELAADLAELRALRMLGADDVGGDWLRSPRAAELRERARQRQWSNTGVRSIPERVDLDALQGALPDDTGHISYVYTRSALVALVVTRAQAKLIPLPGWDHVRTLIPGLRADLDMHAAIGTGPMAAVVARSLDERLEAISRAVLDPAVAALGTRNIVITTPGILGTIPWAMLPGLRDRVFTLALSASRWARMHAAGWKRPTGVGFAAGPRVARGDEEVHTASRAWADPQVMVGTQASVSAVTGLAAEVDLLHVAAHGRHSHEHPLFSGLELADGTLFGYDIDLIENVPDTVILSACEVGRSSVRWGEEAIGMTRVWLHAGARCVVAAPVVVADDDACELLAAMHEGLADGIPPSVALAEASTRTGIVAPFQVHGAGF